MKKKIQEIKNWLVAKHSAHMARKAALQEARLRLESRVLIQVREFGGELYVCFNDLPLLAVKGLKWGIPETLSSMREQWVAYQKSAGSRTYQKSEPWGRK